MKHSYFAVERGGKCVDHITIRTDDFKTAFKDLMNMSYDEMKAYDHMQSFVVAVMDAANSYFNSIDEMTVITLVGADDVFIWSVIINSENSDKMNYAFVDWKKDGKYYRYKKD